MSNEWHSIEQQAIRELNEEERRKAIDAAKERLRKQRPKPWWVRLFPFRIKIERI